MPLFLRGIVLPFQKGKAVKRPIDQLLPQHPLRIPLASATEDDLPQPAGTDGSQLIKGQPLCYNKNTPILTPVCGVLSGTVVLQHPIAGEVLCAEIQPEGLGEDTMEVVPFKDLTPQQIIDTAEKAAIYDELDGQPLATKLRRWQLAENDYNADNCVLVADATDNDIFGSSAWAAVDAEPKMALLGLKMAARAVRMNKSHIAAMLPGKRRRALKRAVGRENVFTVGDEYPVTVYADGKRDVFRIGIQACVALGYALKEGKKHTDTIITVAGDGVPASRHLQVPFGTDIGEILSLCKADPEARLVLGDAMTGLACADTHLPLLPGVTTLLVLKPQQVHLPGPCIGCGRCAAVCHAGLLPYEIVRRLENMHYERLRHLDATACDGCAACSYICPAGRDVAGEVLRATETGGTIFLNWGDEDNE